MPSYNLIRNINLGDLYDTDLSRETLSIGPLGTQYSNHIHFIDGSVKANEMALLSKTHPQFSYILSHNDQGEFIWSTDNNVYSWTLQEDVYLSRFNQDLEYVKSSQLNKVAYTNSFKDLNNIPKTNDLIPNNDRSFFLTFNSNLKDLQNHDIESIKSSLQLGKLAFEPDDLVIMKDISFSNLFMFGNSNQIGSLLMSGPNEHKRDYTIVNQTLWYNPIYNEDGSPKDIFILGNSYKEKSFNHTVSCNTLNKMYNDTLNYINRKQHDLDMERVRETMSNRVYSGDFLVIESNLGDHGLDVYKCRNNLDIGSVASFNYDTTHFIDMTINSSLIFVGILDQLNNNNNLIENTNEQHYLVVSCDDIQGTSKLINISSATTSNYGFVEYVYDITDSNNRSNSVISWNYLTNLENDLLVNLDHLVNSEFLYDFDDYIYDIQTLVDYELSQFSNVHNRDDMENVYNNLNLSKVSVTGDYRDLDKYPTSIHVFTNDLPLLDRVNNCQGIDHYEMMKHLGLSNMGAQNNTNVDINDGSSTLEIVETTNKLYIYPNEPSIVGKWLTTVDSQHTVAYTNIPVATTSKKGFVKKINEYDVAGYDTTVSIQAVQAMFTTLTLYINQLEEDIKDFLYD